jgi:DNA topoisomerase-3
VENKYQFDIDGNTFNLTCKKSLSLGWREYANKKDDTKPWFEYVQGDTIQTVQLAIKECEKQPPKPFTEGTLLSVMENIDRLVEDKNLKKFVKERGLGTPATRSNIIEELISAGYVERSKKVLKSTEYGRNFIKSLPELVTSAELTAQWEQSLNDIENGKTNADTILFEIQSTIDQTIEFEKSRKQRTIVSRKKSVGKCPRCGGEVLENSKAYQCTNLCGFTLWKQCKLIGRELSTAEVKNLLNGETTLKNCTSSKGKSYSANFQLEDTGKYINLKLVSFCKK